MGPALSTLRGAGERSLPAAGTVGKFELVVMMVLAILSFVGAPFYIAFLGALLLMLSTMYEYAHLQPRFVRAGATRLMTGGVVFAAATSLAFASLCFAIGRFFAWIIAS
jgi:hypothetical protein